MCFVLTILLLDMNLAMIPSNLPAALNYSNKSKVRVLLAQPSATAGIFPFPTLSHFPVLSEHACDRRIFDKTGKCERVESSKFPAIVCGHLILVGRCTMRTSANTRIYGVPNQKLTTRSLWSIPTTSCGLYSCNILSFPLHNHRSHHFGSWMLSANVHFSGRCNRRMSSNKWICRRNLNSSERLYSNLN